MQLQLFFDANKENLYNIDFKNCIFSNLWLNNANFEGSSFYRVDFLSSKLIDSNFQLCRFSLSDFTNTDLSGSNLDFARLNVCKFNNTNLTRIAFKKLIIYVDKEGPVYCSDKKIEKQISFANNNNREKNIYFVRNVLRREILIQNDLDDRICEKFLETDIRKIGKMIYKGLLKNGIENEELEYNPEMTRWTLLDFFDSYNDEFRIYTINHKELKKIIPEWYKTNFSDYFIHFLNFISKFLSSPKSNLSFITF